MLIRGWILLSCLALGALFRLNRPFTGNGQTFLFNERVLDRESHVYYSMEHVIAIAFAFCIINPNWLRDNTPKWVLWVFIGILTLDYLHYYLFFRDEGAGWNLIKMTIFGFCVLYVQLNRQWTHLKK